MFDCFRLVAGGIAEGLTSRWRRQEISAVMSGDYSAYLVQKSLHFAEEHRAMGHKISDKRVLRIIHTRDRVLCNGMTPYELAHESFKDAQTALISVRESIREELGLAQPRMGTKELINFKVESGL